MRALGVAPPQTDPHAPGPFAFADAGRVRAILQGAGFEDVAIVRGDAPMRLGDTLEEAARASLEMGPAAALLRESGADPATLLAPIADALRPWSGPDGVAAPGAVWIVTARRP